MSPSWGSWALLGIPWKPPAHEFYQLMCSGSRFHSDFDARELWKYFISHWLSQDVRLMRTKKEGRHVCTTEVHWAFHLRPSTILNMWHWRISIIVPWAMGFGYRVKAVPRLDIIHLNACLRQWFIRQEPSAFRIRLFLLHYALPINDSGLSWSEIFLILWMSGLPLLLLSCWVSVTLQPRIAFELLVLRSTGPQVLRL